MKSITELAKKIVEEKSELSFSVYSSIKEQRILNVPILKPLLIFVLEGIKQLGKNNKMTCQAGEFIFLSNSPLIDMRNIPKKEEYFALLIEFEFDDFNQFHSQEYNSKKYFQGQIDPILEKALQQYIEWSVFAPKEVWHFRRQELLRLMFQLGHKEVRTFLTSPSLSHRLHGIISDDISGNLNVSHLAGKLGMSNSTLRRKLKGEGVSILAIKNRVRLSYGLHLVQTTMKPIGLIAEHCGYCSHSRFTKGFKQLFGVNPLELRKTRMND